MQTSVKFLKEKIHRKYSVDISMRDFTLPGIKEGLWMTGIFDMKV
jgi:hypothetical protein